MFGFDGPLSAESLPGFLSFRGKGSPSPLSVISVSSGVRKVIRESPGYPEVPAY